MPSEDLSHSLHQSKPRATFQVAPKPLSPATDLDAVVESLRGRLTLNQGPKRTKRITEILTLSTFKYGGPYPQ